MLEIIKSAVSKRASNAVHGDVQTLLTRLCVEVVAANYRYFLHEYLDKFESADHSEQKCWPPLLANERQVSGIFAHALSSVCPVSRPEMAITRGQPKNKVARKAKAVDTNGRMDFYATYGQRSIALELKRTTTSTGADHRKWKVLKHQWASVGNQALQALSFMRKFPTEFPHAVAISFLVVRPSRTLTLRQLTPEIQLSEAERFTELVKNFGKVTKPDFLAAYRPPAEMQISAEWGENGEKFKLFPGVIFAANVWARTT
jgi:hypothetical protein